MRIPFRALQEALIARLSAGLGDVPIYSPLVPAGTAAPFANVSGNMTLSLEPQRIAQRDQWTYEVSCYINTLSAKPETTAESDDILNTIGQLLSQPLGVEGYDWGGQEITRMSTATGQDATGSVQSGTVEFRIWLASTEARS